MFQKVLLSLLVIISTATNGCCQLLELTTEGQYDLQSCFFHLRDAGGTLEIAEAEQRTDFVQTADVNFGFDDAVHWFRFDLFNPTAQSEWLLEIPFAPLDEVVLFSKNNGRWERKVSGDAYPMSVREFRHQTPVFRILIPQGDTARFFLRVRSTSSVQVASVLWNPYSFYTTTSGRQLFNGLFYGALAVMMLYQLFLFVSTRDKVSLYYVFTLLAMTHVVAFFQGYSFLYLYPENPSISYAMAILTGPFFLIFSTALTRSFLNLPQLSRPLDIVFVLNTWVDVILSVVMLIFAGLISFRYHHYAILFHSLIALVAAAYSIHKRYKPALFYLLSWLTLLVAAFVFSLSNLGMFSHNITNSTWLVTGCIIQILFVSFALGNRWLNINRENQQAKEQELRRRVIEKERLEFQVQQRTHEIQRKNEELEEVGRVKDKLFSVVSHDIKGPLTSLQLALGLIKNHTIRQDEFQELAQVLETRFKQTTRFIENLLQWASIQLKGSTFAPAQLALHPVAQATVELLDYDIQQKEVEVKNEIPDTLHVFADVNMVRSVLRNLLANAIKFTSSPGLITINAVEESGQAVISVADTGIGIPEANRARLFSLDSITTLGTQKEKGTGLGLLICRELIEKNRGRIWFESEEGKGTTFYFTLPLNDPASPN